MTDKPTAAEKKAAKSEAKSNRPWFKKKRFIIPIAFVALIVIISVANSNKGSNSNDAASSSGTSVAADSTPSETAAATPAAAAVPTEYKSALNQAGSYLGTFPMCKARLYDQLVSQYGGQFSPEAAQYAVDNVKTDWNANALEIAKNYQTTMNMSPAAIHDQLVSDAGEKCTTENADYAIANLPA